MASYLTSEIPMRPIELVDLDTDEHSIVICKATVRFLPTGPRASRAKRPTGAGAVSIQRPAKARPPQANAPDGGFRLK
jgi:hypothetical protein